MSERVLIGHKKYHRIIGETERGNPKVACGAHSLLQRVKVLKRHQAVFKDKCQVCYEAEK